MESQTRSEEFWKNTETAQKVNQLLSQLRGHVGKWESLHHDIKSMLDLARELEKENDDELEQEVARKTEDLAEIFKEQEFLVFFNGKFDERGAIVSISAGAGGTDAQDWAEMLERMLMRYCEAKGFRISSIDRQRGNEAGIKSSVFEVSGAYPYGWLKSEAGVHRLVRISPYDAEKMRHTSFALVDIIPDLGDLSDIVINDEDIRVDVFRASGHGGQSVNTTDSAVRIVHSWSVSSARWSGARGCSG